MIDERRDFLAPLAQRRQVEADDVEAVEEVLAEAAVGDERSRSALVAAMTRTSTLTGCALAERVDLVGLEEAQQLRLQLGADLGDLVEEERAAGGGADHALEGACRRR